MSARVCNPSEHSPFGHGFPFHHHRGHPRRCHRTRGEGAHDGSSFASGPRSPFDSESGGHGFPCGRPGGFARGFHRGFGPHHARHFGPGHHHPHPGFGFPFPPGALPPPPPPAVPGHPSHFHGPPPPPPPPVPDHPSHFHGPPPPYPPPHPHHFHGFGPFGPFGYAPHHGHHDCHHFEERNMEGDNSEKKEHSRRCRRHRPGCRSRHHHRDHHGHQEDESRHDIQGHGFNIDHQETVTGELDNRLKGHLDMLEALYRSSVQTIDDSYKAARAAEKDAYRAAKLAAATTATTVNADASGDTDMGDESNNKEKHDDKSSATKEPAVDCREIRQAMKEAKREWREGRAKIYDELQRQMVSVAAQMVQELTNASATAESGPSTGAVNSSSSSDASAPFIPAHEESEKVESTSAPMTASSDTKSDDQIPRHEQERLAFIHKLQNWIAAAQTRLNKPKQGYEHTEKDHDANVAPSFGSKSCGPCHNEGGWTMGCPSVQGYPYFYYGFHGNDHPLDPNDEGAAEGTSTGGSSSSLPPYSPPLPYPSMFATHPRFANKMARLHEKHMRQCGRMMHKFERKMERTRRAMMHADRRRHCSREGGRNCRGEEEECHTDVSEKPTLVSTDKDKKDKQKKTFQRDDTNDTTLTMDFDSKSVNKQDHSDDSISSSDFEDDSDSDLDFELALGLEDNDSCGGENEKKTDRNGDCSCNNEEDMDE